MANEERERNEPAVVIRGLDEATFQEMESFVKDLEIRPAEDLVRALPQLAGLTTAKFSLVSHVLVRKYNQALEADRESMRAIVTDAIERSHAGQARERIARTLARMR